MAGSLLAWLKLYKGEMFTGIANKVGPYLSAVLQRDSTKTDSVRLCGNILSVIGLALILTAVFALDNKDFPGYKALLPVMGAVLMIAAGKDAFLNRYLLSNRVMVWFGLISYPLYIWHWPFLSFAWIVGGEMPQLKVRIGCVVLAVIMSAVTYYFVEPRLRWGRYGGYKAAGLLSVMVVTGVAGYSIERHDGYTARMNDPEQPVIDAINKRLSEDNMRCLSVIQDWSSMDWDITRCGLQRSAGKNTIAVIGDSHAGHLYAGLTAQNIDDDGIAVFPAACAIPLMGVEATPEAVKKDPFRANSGHLLSEGFDYILRHQNIKKVLLSHATRCSWHSVMDGFNPDNHNFESVLHDGFLRTYEALSNAGKEIFVVLDNPAYRGEIFAKCKASVVARPSVIPDLLASKNAKNCSIELSEREDKERIDNWSQIARETARGYKNIHFIDLAEAFCNNGMCSMLDQKGNMLYGDSNHLNAKGSIYVAPFIIRQLKQ